MNDHVIRIGKGMMRVFLDNDVSQSLVYFLVSYVFLVFCSYYVQP